MDNLLPKRRKPPMTEPEERRIVAALKDGISQRSVAERFGRALRVVSEIAVRYGLAKKDDDG